MIPLKSNVKMLSVKLLGLTLISVLLFPDFSPRALAQGVVEYVDSKPSKQEKSLANEEKRGVPRQEQMQSNDIENQLNNLLTGYTRYLAMLQKISSPFARKIQKLVTHSEFIKNLEYILEYTDWLTLAVGELLLMVGMIIFRAWRFSRVRHWLARLWVSAWTLVFGILLASFFVPFLVIGKPFLDLLGIVVKVLLP